MSDLKALAAIIDGVYDTAIEPTHWPNVLAEINRAVGTEKAMVHCMDYHMPKFDLYHQSGIETRWMSAYAEHYHRLDEWRARWDRGNSGDVVTGDVLIAPHDMQRTEFGADFLRPQGLDRLLTMGLVGSSSAGGYLSTYRSAQEKDFGDRERRIFATLLPHARRSIAVGRRLAQHTNQLAAAHAALDSLAYGTILIASDRRILFMNKAAAAIVAVGDGLTVENDRLKAGRSHDASLLAALITRAIPTSGSRIRSSGQMRVTRSRLAPPYDLFVIPLTERAPGWTSERAVALIFVSDPERKVCPPYANLMGLYGLTRAEARLAQALGAGQTVADFAEEHGLTISTVRVHLKHVLAKTDTHRQAELIRLLIGLPEITHFGVED